VVAVRRVDELGFYSLNLTEISKKLALTTPKTLAVVRELKLQQDSEYFKEITIGANHFKRYSPRALERIRQELPKLDLDEVWSRNKPSGRKK
jgi:cell division protein FtsI/penicillin-binding protein 2